MRLLPNQFVDGLTDYPFVNDAPGEIRDPAPSVAANLASRELGGMHVDVNSACPERPDEFADRSGRETLVRQGKDVARGDDAAHAPARRRADRLRATTAQKGSNATRRRVLAEVDVRGRRAGMTVTKPPFVTPSVK